MVIRWDRIFGLLLGLVLLIVLLRGDLPNPFASLEADVHRPPGQVERVATLGLLCITLVAVVKLLRSKN